MDLSILIPSRNEEFLVQTVEDLLKNIEGNTEVIVVLDGYDRKDLNTDLPKDPRVKVIVNDIPEGQRLATNHACKMSEAKYIMKVDAHCAFDKGFDVKMMSKMKDNYTMIPIMRNLHAFDWVCAEGHRRYQGTSGPCTECNDEPHKDIVWIAKTNPASTSFCFDETPHFQYFNDFKRRPESTPDKDNLSETMSIQGSCFMLTRDKYWELNISDDKAFGSWGSQGIEVACKTWLSGGRVVVNHDTWYAHMFRTQGGDFGFPYHQEGRKIDHAKKYTKELFFDNKWDKQVLPLSWLIEKFWPVKGWTEEMRQKIKAWPLKGYTAPVVAQEGPTKGIIYYTDNKLKWSIAKVCREQIKRSGLPIVSCTLKKADMGKNIVLKAERGYLTMFKQILTALEASTADIIFFTEHDVIYHPSHFDFIPTDRNCFYYESNYWFLRFDDGFAIRYNCSPLSGLCGFREELITHFKERVELIEKIGFSYNIGFEPMTHNRIDWKTKYRFELFQSELPNVDISHGANVTKKRWSQDQFRRKPTFWEEGKCPEWVENLIKQMK